MESIRWSALAATVLVFGLGLFASPARVNQEVTQSRVIAALALLPAKSRLTSDAQTDVHSLLLQADRVALTDLARQLCREGQLKPDQEVNPLSMVGEPHAGQTLLAVSMVAIRLRTKDIPICGEPLLILLRRETEKPGYQMAQQFISKSLPALVEAERANAGPETSVQFAEWHLSAARRRLRQRLTERDLSWYAQLVALRLMFEHKASQASFGSTSQSYASLKNVINVQLKYVATNAAFRGLNYLTENGVHTLSMLLVALDVLDSRPEWDVSDLRHAYRSSAKALFAELVANASLDASDGLTAASRGQLRAHLVHLALCGRRPLLTPDHNNSESSSAPLDVLARHVLNDVESGRAVASWGWHLHAREALVELLYYLRQEGRHRASSACICV